MGRERSRYVDDYDDDVLMMEDGGGDDGGDGDGGSGGGAAPPAPAWLGGLVAETFFGGCGVHVNRRKNEKNVYCLLCCLSICPHCLPSHHSHPLLQVRRYVYHDVVRLGDLEKLIDCSYIQPYTINSAKVIFLKQRPQSRSSCTGNNKGGSANLCFTCDRILQHPFHFCSLSCKVDHLVDQEEDLSTIILNRIDETSDDQFAFSEFEGLNLRMDSSADDQIQMMMVDEDDDGQITTTDADPDPDPDPDPCQYRGSSCSNHATGNPGISHEPEMIMKKKKKNGFLPGLVLSLSSRRKGAPHRAPLS